MKESTFTREDHLAVLELKPDATEDDIRKAYRELCMIWHPDRHPEHLRRRAEEKLKELNIAYEWLKNHPSGYEQRSQAREGDAETPPPPERKPRKEGWTKSREANNWMAVLLCFAVCMSIWTVYSEYWEKREKEARTPPFTIQADRPKPKPENTEFFALRVSGRESEDGTYYIPEIGFSMPFSEGWRKLPKLEEERDGAILSRHVATFIKGDGMIVIDVVGCHGIAPESIVGILNDRIDEARLQLINDVKVLNVGSMVYYALLGVASYTKSYYDEITSQNVAHRNYILPMKGSILDIQVYSTSGDGEDVFGDSLRCLAGISIETGNRLPKDWHERLKALINGD